MQRSLFLSTVCVAALMFSGCCCGPYGGCGPVGCGIAGGGGGCTTNCNDCDGTYSTARPIVYGPLHFLTQMRKSLVCGGGCGEVYYGEWQSTPPDACGPCNGSQFVGGAVPCNPFCWNWRPGQFLFGFLGSIGNIYGQRYYTGVCGCGGGYAGDCGCDSGGYNTGFSYDVGGGCDSGTCGGGCSTCNAGSAAGPSNRVAAPPQIQQNHRTARRPQPIQRGISSRYAKPPTQYR